MLWMVWMVDGDGQDDNAMAMRWSGGAGIIREERGVFARDNALITNHNGRPARIGRRQRFVDDSKDDEVGMYTYKNRQR